MIDFEAALNLMNKYGYTSTTTPPYLYRCENKLGVCYRYLDKTYGVLERSKSFDSLEEMDAFLSRFRFLEENGEKENIRMVLDNYEIENPKNIFLRNDKPMAKGEMFAIASFIEMRKQEELLDPVSRVILEAGKLLVYYDDIKNRRLLYSKALLELENSLKNAYYQLQKEVDLYNGIKMIREVELLPIVAEDIGINEIMENSSKERYLQYKAKPPSLEEAQNFLREVWDLLLNLELFPKYFENQQREREIHNEMRIVEEKLRLMKALNREEKDFFSIDLMRQFRAINRRMKEKTIPLDSNYVANMVQSVTKKYSYFDVLDMFLLDDYLNEALTNTNYEDLALKYHKNSSVRKIDMFSSPQKVSSALLKEYKTNLSIDEQAVLLLYHSLYRELLDYLLAIPDLFSRNNQELISFLLKDKYLLSLKNTCYDLVKYHMEQPCNSKVKTAVFHSIDFTSFDTFLLSLIKSLALLKNINEKMRITHDLVMYGKGDFSLSNTKYLYVTQNLASLLGKEKSVVIVTLRAGAPVIFCPYQIDFGNLSNKKEPAQFQIAYMKEFELFLDLDDLLIRQNEQSTTVGQYSSFAKIEDEVTVVQSLQMQYYTCFKQMTLLPKEEKKNNGGVSHVENN